MCASNPSVVCVTHADCTDPAFSYCALDGTGKICSGLGRPGTSTACNLDGDKTINTPPNNKKDNSMDNTLVIAGASVGAVALLAILFAFVRWRRNRSRSKMPDFSEIDYGMSSRRSQRRSTGAGAGAGAGGAGGNQSYPFSSRPHAQQGVNGGAAGQDEYYDDQYYDESYAQNNNMHPMAGMAGGAVKGQEDQYYDNSYNNNYGYDQGYAQQGYDQQGYDQQGYGYDQQGYDQYYNNGGYDQHGNYVGDGNAYYDPNANGAGYDNGAYGDKAATPVNSSTKAPTAPPEAIARSGSQNLYGGTANNYSAEHPEQDFGNAGQHNGGYNNNRQY
ncbi:hypothetical protein BGX34_002943 [Mortierella sp. NVP85]|nr:hypothetical protein BGX34_002943 [Mortierella sp. NVP85]